MGQLVPECGRHRGPGVRRGIPSGIETPPLRQGRQRLCRRAEARPTDTIDDGRFAGNDGFADAAPSNTTTSLPAPTTTVAPPPVSLRGEIVFTSNRQSSCQFNCTRAVSADAVDLWSTNPDATDQKELTPPSPGTGGDLYPDLSNDGTRIT